MKRTIPILAVALLAVGLGAGCRSVEPKPVAHVEPLVKHGAPDYIADRRIITDPDMDNLFEIGGINTSTTAECLLRVQVRLTNLTDDLQSVEYRFEWTDANMMVFDTPASRWVPIKLKPKDSQLVWAVAPNPAVKDFYFKANSRRK